MCLKKPKSLDSQGVLPIRLPLTMQLNKTDRNDALGIARLVHSGWYRPTHVKSLQCHQLRLVLTAREKLVQIRVTLINQIRGLLKTFGVVLPAGRNSVFERSVVESSPSIAEVKPTVLMLMQTLKDIGTQVRALDKKLLSFTNSVVYQNRRCLQALDIDSGRGDIDSH